MRSLVPNFFTSLNLALGVLCIIFATQGNFIYGGCCILGSLVADALDGRTARALGVSGEFGKELDSLADVVSFGVASAFLMYEFLLKDLGYIGIAATLFYSVCGGLRLARFNISTTVVKGYFMGVAIPTGGCLLATIAISGVRIPAEIMAGIVVIVGYLLVSKFHYPNFKEQSADPINKSAIAAIIVIGLIAIFVNWRTLVFLPFALYIIFGIINSLINKISA